MDRDIFTRVVVSASLVVCWGGASLEAQETSRPNVLFLFADDLSYEAIGSLDLVDIDTPNLDRLAARGTRFSHAYNMGSWSGAVCIASRTMLITGRHVWNARDVHATTDAERQAGRLWPLMLKSAGYSTYMTGKWHINTAADKCFDTTRHVRPGMPATVPQSYDRPREGQADSWSSSDSSLGGFWEGGKHWSEVAADDAIEFLSMAKEEPDPFFMYVAFNAPHDPRQAPQEYLDRYPLERIELPQNFLPLYPYRNEIGCSKDLRDEALGPFPRTEFAVKTHRREYFALITHLDAQIGRVLDALEQSGKADQTLVVFTADHGLAVGHHGLFGKQNSYDHSVRVPFLIAGPGVPSGQTIDASIYLQDVVPTTLQSAGVAQPEHVEFQSLWPLISGQTTVSAYPAVYGAYLKLQRSVTFEGWKLIAYPEAKVLRLFDLTNDPQEQIDLVNERDQQAKIDLLWSKLQELQQATGDDLNLNSVFPERE